MWGERQWAHSADGTEIGILSAGQGPALLLVHGGLVTSAAWAPVWPLLTGSYRVTVMDRRGRGMSGDAADYTAEREYADVEAVCDHLAQASGGPVDVVAHSYGAVCALGAAARGARVRRLVLYEPPGPPILPTGWLGRANAMIVAGRADQAMASFATEIVGLAPHAVAAMGNHPVVQAAIPVAATTMIRETTVVATIDLAKLASGVAVPVLLLCGERSPHWAAAVTQQLYQALESSSVVTLPGQGHMAISADPELFTAEINRFLGNGAP